MQFLGYGSNNNQAEGYEYFSVKKKTAKKITNIHSSKNTYTSVQETRSIGIEEMGECSVF